MRSTSSLISPPRLVDENNRALIPTPELPADETCFWKELAYCSSEKARRLLEFSIAWDLMVLPLSVAEERGERILTVAIPEGAEDSLIERLRFATTSSIVVETVAQRVLEKAILLAYLGDDAQAGENIERLISEHKSSRDALSRAAPGPLSCIVDQTDESTMARAWESILARALFLSASDIHLEPHEKHSCFSFRINGFLEPQQDMMLPRETAQSFVRFVKVKSGVDTTGVARAGEGSFSWTLGRPIRLRVSMVPALYGDKIVIRILENEFFERCSEHLFDVPEQPGIAAFRQIGMTDYQYRILHFYLRQERGLILTTGPTGSGKSTLLYLLVLLLQGASRNVFSIEDPVERVIEGVTQVEVQGGLSFADLLKRSLRQDPDVLMIGEVRDRETAEQTCVAASAGSLVLSTMHAANAAEVFTRCAELGIDARRLGSALKLSISQRLVRLLCRHCKKESAPSSLTQRIFAVSAEHVLFSAAGCRFCRGCGVSGRRGLFEMLPMSLQLRDMLFRESLSAQQMQSRIEELQRKGGLPAYCSLFEQVRDLLLDGLVCENAALESLGIRALGSG